MCTQLRTHTHMHTFTRVHIDALEPLAQNHPVERASVTLRTRRPQSHQHPDRIGRVLRMTYADVLQLVEKRVAVHMMEYYLAKKETKY